MTRNPSAATFDVIVGASPSGQLNIDHELNVVKPALLYGDSVTLISPVVSSFRFAAELESLSFRDAMARTAAFMKNRDPALAAEAQTYLEERDRLANLGWRTQSERERWTVLSAMEQRYVSQEEVKRSLLPTPILEMADGDPFRTAEEAGILRIEPFMTPTELLQAEQVEVQMRAYLSRLIQHLSQGSSYPLFDDFSGQMIMAAEIDGLYTPGKLTDSHGKQIGTAAHLLRRLPVFPNATIAEILDLRREMIEPLVRFRAAMIGFADDIEVVAFDQDFSQYAEELARARVDPAMLEVEELVRQNKYLKHFQEKAAANLPTIGPVVAVGISLFTDLPALTGPALALLQSLWQAELERRKQQNEVRQHQLYLLYRANELLSQGKPST